jgi:MICOS complex subunit MIC60
MPPPKPKHRLLRPRNFFALLLLSTFAYGGAVWYSFKSDNFHDFFTEYVPGASQTINAIQDYEFNQKYPGAAQIRKGERISVLGRKGPHISAVEANKPEVIEKKKEDEKKEKEVAKKKNEESKQGKGKGKSAEEQKGTTVELIPKTSAPSQTSDEAKRAVEKEPPVKRDPAGKTPQADTTTATKGATPKPSKKDTATSSPGPDEHKKSQPKPAVPRESTDVTKPAKDTSAPAVVSPPSPAPSSGRLLVHPLDISPNDASLEKLTTALNDLIKTFNSQATYDATSAPLYEFLKSSVSELNSHLPELVSSTKAEAESQVRAQAEYFSRLHEELQNAMIQERNLMANEWMAAFDRERDELQKRYNERLAEELKKQGEVNDSRLENELLEQAIGLKRRWMREIQSQVEMERGGRLGKLAALEKALTELTGLHADSAAVFSKSEKAMKTAIAVQALREAALNRGGGFTNELATLKSLSNNDDLVRAVIGSIDPEAYTNGIISPAQLAARFQTLAVELRKISLLPEDAGVAGHAASWLLSHIMFRQRGYVKGDDVESRLARVEALLEAGQLEDATREMNSFNGWGRELSRDWLREARKRLEVAQAVEVPFPTCTGCD